MTTPFLLTPDNALAPLKRTPYNSEDLFQRLLADHPALLREIAGADGRLLLVQREAPVPDAAEGAGRWSLDHLFLDREGVPVLVEVKRASDTRARREVVAQMLDYAANGVAYWPLDQIQTGFAKAAQEASEDPDARLMAFLDGAEAEPFWRQVEANLRSGRIRMVFVADAIPKELRRIVEFLNEQMRPAEVLALEVEQHATPDGTRMLTPRLVGKTERAETTKAVGASTGPVPSIEAWLLTLAEAQGADAERGARRALQWAQELGLRATVTSTHDAVAFSLPQPNGKWAWPFFLRRSNGQLQTALQYLAHTAAFAADAARADLLERFKGAPSVYIPSNRITAWPGVPLSELANEAVWSAWVAIGEDITHRLTA